MKRKGLGRILGILLALILVITTIDVPVQSYAAEQQTTMSEAKQSFINKYHGLEYATLTEPEKAVFDRFVGVHYDLTEGSAESQLTDLPKKVSLEGIKATFPDAKDSDAAKTAIDRFINKVYNTLFLEVEDLFWYGKTGENIILYSQPTTDSNGTVVDLVRAVLWKNGSIPGWDHQN